MDRNPRNQTLLAQLSAHNPFKKELAPRLFEALKTFELDIEAIAQDRRLSAEGRRDKAKEHVQKALGVLDGLQKPIADYRKQTESLRSEIKTPSYDKTDNYAAALRRELRDRAASMSFGQRAALMSGSTRDPNFVDAVLEQAAWVSGFNIHNPNELELYETARESRLRDLNGSLMDTLEARAGVEAEIMMVVNVVRNDLQSDATDLASRAA
jgi:hypothetical protein